MAVFNSILNFINRFRNQKEESEEIISYSKFGEFLYDAENDDEYENIKIAVGLCDKALAAAKQRVYFVRKLKEYEARLQEVDCYNKLTDDEAEELKSLVDKFVSLTKERNILRYQLVDFDKGVNRFAKVESDAENAVYRMENAEYNQRVLKQDIGYLESEKEELQEERKKLIFGLDFIYKFSIAMVILFAVVVVVLAINNVFRQQVVFFSLSIMAVMAIFIIALVYFFRRKIVYELKLNTKKQERAVEILNKKNVVYAYYTNFLKYECEKFQVRNSDMLRNHIKEYDNYKHITSRYDSIRNIMYQTQDILEKFLRDKNISVVNASIERFAQTINIDDKIEYCKEINAAKDEAEFNLKELDEKHAQLWNVLMEMNANDKSKDNIIQNLIDAYLEETSRIDFVINDEDETEENY